MSPDVVPTEQLPPMPARTADPRSYTAAPQGPGWIAFAGSMLAIVGVLNVLYGIAATSNSKFFVRNVEYVFGNLNTWGWFMVVLGALQLLAAISIWRGGELGRWFGVFCAGGNAVIQMVALPSYPLLALSLFAVDIIIIWTLVTYGGRTAEPA